MIDDGPYEVEPLEELEALETADAAAAESSLSAGSLELAGFAAGHASEPVKDLVSSYSIVPIPIAILDSSLEFLYKNDPFKRLLASFRAAREPTLLGAIGRFIDAETARSLYVGLKDPKRGHSWSGTIRLKSKDSSSVLAKTTIMPFKPEGSAGQEPQAWVAFFDDVTEERNGFLRGLFSSLLEASKLKDNDTGKHIERVNLYTELLARELYRLGNWPDVDVDFVENIGFLAAMHDVGKIGTPDDILNKKGPLDEFEWSIMKEHTINGAFILSSYPNPMAKQIAQSHHEWWNGTGYPYNLVGDMIPLPARIVALADVYDALRMRRSYKAPFDHGRASLLIASDSGTHFDPSLVEIFKSIGGEFAAIYDSNADEPSA
ncbi:MAG: HD-GYP domain-containing protein [Spirochaetes bacterium]|nr:HD-GYP domain-containing protein [Spirochaetota bacterium]MBU1081445.1 HD-GYP domain-containing protein [Spirochaetota bacterium]